MQFGENILGFTECKEKCLLTGNRGQIDYYFETGTYENRQIKNWIIRSSCVGGIIIRSRDFDLEDGYDFLKISADTRSVYTGSDKIIQNIHDRSFNVTFESDIDVTGKGFVLNWECAQIDEFGVIEYSNYKANKNETWIIESTCSSNVRVISTIFDTGYGNDNLTINGNEYNGITPIDQRISRGYGTEFVQFAVTFESDESANDDGIGRAFAIMTIFKLSSK